MATAEDYYDDYDPDIEAEIEVVISDGSKENMASPSFGQSKSNKAVSFMDVDRREDDEEEEDYIEECYREEEADRKPRTQRRKGLFRRGTKSQSHSDESATAASPRFFGEEDERR